MLPSLFITWLSILPMGFAIISCRIACRQCREKTEHPDMLEVYCAMCNECKDRRREWLDGPPSLLRVEKEDNFLTNYGQQDSQDDCPTTPTDEDCEPPPLLTRIVTTSTTSTTTTTTTTRKPCPPRPFIKATRSPCDIACPIQMAIPVCQMCPMQISGPYYTVASSSVRTYESTTQPSRKELSRGTFSATSELYFYLGVPKKLLKQLQVTRSQK